MHKHNIGEMIQKRIDDKQRQEAMMILSQILKDVLNGEYIPIPKCLPVEEEDKIYFKEKAILSIRTAMEELDKELNLEEGLSNSLMMSRLDSV